MLVIWFDELDAVRRAGVDVREWRWCRTAADGANPSEEGRATLQSIAEMLTVEPDDVTLLLAARECLHVTLTAPPMSARNLELALPYIAEEHLASAVDDTHIAPGERDGDQLAAFAVSKMLLGQLLDALARYNIAPVAAYSDASMIEPPTAGDECASLMVDGGRVLMRSAHTSLEADLANLSVLLPVLLACANDQEDPKMSVRVLCEPDSAIHEELSSLEVRAIPDAVTENPFRILVSRGFSSATNLLVGEFQPSRRSTHKRQWRVPLALAASLLALMLVTDIGLGMVAQSRVAAMQTQAIEKLGGAMDADAIVRLVNREQGGRGQETTYFIDVASALSTVAAAHDASVQSLSYQQGSRALDVEILVADYDQLDRVSSEARTAFGEAEILGATQTDDGVRARFRLTRLSL